MTPIEPPFVSPPNPQKNSVFFTLFPKELRDQLFDLAITPYEKREAFLPEDLEYHRPDFRNSYRRISTALLRTCQRIYGETCDIPARNYIKIDWYFSFGLHGHGVYDTNSADLAFPTKMQSLQVYTTSRDLCDLHECWNRYIDQVAAQAPGLRHLKLTLGHGEGQTSETRLLPHPDIPEGKPNVCHNFFWGYRLASLSNLTILEVEAETIIDRMEELDDAVGKAMNWRITVASNKKLVLNPEKTRREGWHGRVLSKILSPTNSAGTNTSNSQATMCLRQQLQRKIFPGISSTT